MKTHSHVRTEKYVRLATSLWKGNSFRQIEALKFVKEESTWMLLWQWPASLGNKTKHFKVMTKQVKVHFATVHETFVFLQLYTPIKHHCLSTPCQNDWMLYTRSNCNSWLYNEAIKDECQNIWWGQRWRNTTVGTLCEICFGGGCS